MAVKAILHMALKCATYVTDLDIRQQKLVIGSVRLEFLNWSVLGKPQKESIQGYILAEI